MNLRRLSLSLALASLVSLGAAQAAMGAVILNFQAGLNNVATSTNAAGVTTITGEDVPVTMAVENSAAVTSFLDFTFTSSGVAVVNGGNIEQNFSGTFSFNSAADNSGTNFLSGSFQDLASGPDGGDALTLSAATPSDTVNFTSDVATSLGLERALSLSFTNLSSPLSIVGSSINSFTAAMAGNFSGNVGTVVPEPATVLLFGSALAGIAIRLRRRRH